jgi:ribose transport system ATP-binding protein
MSAAAALPGVRRHALLAQGISKTFSGVRALRSVDLQIGRGEIHALLGENGSGKSTLIKVLSGYHRPEQGEILVASERMVLGSAQSSYALGCRFVHQELALIDSLSVVDNLFLNSGYPRRFGTVRERDARDQAHEQLALVGLDLLDPRAVVSQLSPAVKTGIAVARALMPDTDVPAALLVLDEPTATLHDDEVRQLHAIVGKVAATGVGVLYVTHRLDEVFKFADNVTVLRDGRCIAVEPVASLDRHRLVNLLVGDEFEEIHASSEALPPVPGGTVLQIRDLAAGPMRAVSFSVGAGDIVGIAGITGSGRETLLGSLFGATPRGRGTVTVNGFTIRSGDPAAAIAVGVGYLPPDRKLQGALLVFSATENLTLADLRPFWRRMRLQHKAETSEVQRWFARLSVRPVDGHDRPLATFSGGNQQKILFAKWLRRNPKVLLLDEPTQGVDVSAKAELHRQLLAAAQDGAAVVISSSEVEELAALCHRVLVLRDGMVVADLTGKEISVMRILKECLGTPREVSGDD